MWRVRPGDIETSKSPPDLEKALGRLSQLARASREERGVNTLYVALGMLEWRPLSGADPQLAPLLMVPVELGRETRLEPHVLSPFDEDAEINPTLVYMLRKDFEFTAPEFDPEPTEASLETFFRKLDRAVKGRGWRVLQEAWLGQFQFKKLAMYKDLEEHSSRAGDHQTVDGPLLAMRNSQSLRQFRLLTTSIASGHPMSSRYATPTHLSSLRSCGPARART